MHLMAAGFSTMYLNERLVFGLAPPDIAGVFSQRLRWAMGALQILLRRNPLAAPGLTLAQSLLFFESCAYHFLAASTVLTSLAPVPFLFLGASPLQCDSLWEFTIAFGTFYALNRLMLFMAHRGTEGAMLEMWRGSQTWIWMSPNHLKAVFKVVLAESGLPWWLGGSSKAI
ncbi:cellulose synthase (UDP-forming) [Monoraphidium neglectum]|uniref:Cellulose synthase (UDP-forming) n=1 Tax=Monoraphidium neglectum TaxID=145388 RepID=A0A0D2M0S1_9CHLO|nr:cellulose synthase (UDP-forming) [Monoraphidium neglectum]KIY95081.1 cellulose synthase (UDP-forming) [Monoraphidium neglectum]|eukprot:XP_013894101.1 cellulose synthase (UDP-forming) [Monoraphidium neglectum]